jgi:hypothetical protein
LGAFLDIRFGMAWVLRMSSQICCLLLCKEKLYRWRKIKVNSHQGEIIAIDNISLTLKTASGKLIIPIQQIVDNTPRRSTLEARTKNAQRHRTTFCHGEEP